MKLFKKLYELLVVFCSNVLGSYAHFLWNVEDNEEDQDVSQQQKIACRNYHGTGTSAAT